MRNIKKKKNKSKIFFQQNKILKSKNHKIKILIKIFYKI
jgi:hypothetical protein